MKKIFLGLAAALMLTACNENRQPEAMTSVDSASVVTDLMMSRRSIRAYKDSAHQPRYPERDSEMRHPCAKRAEPAVVRNQSDRFSCTHRFNHPSRGKG